MPAEYGRSEAVHLETRTKITVPEIQKLLNSAPGIVVIDGHGTGMYPTAATDAARKAAAFAGRIRDGMSHPRGVDMRGAGMRGVDMWVVSDNLLQRGAFGSVEIAEILVNRFM